MRAALGDQHPVAVPEGLHGRRAGAQRAEVALAPREQNRERRERHALRRRGVNLLERLGVGDDESDVPLADARKDSRQLRRLADDGDAAEVEELAHDLLLRQDEPPLRRGCVDRAYADHDVATGDEICQERDVGLLHGHAGKADAEGLDALARRGGDGDLPFRDRRLRRQVALAPDDDRLDAAPFAFREKPPLRLVRRLAAWDNDHRDVRDFEDGKRLRDAHRAKLPFVVEPRGVRHEARAEGQYLHRLGDRVGSGAGDVGDDREVLPGERVDKRRLAGVAPPEERDARPHAVRGLVQLRHVSLPSIR